MVGGNYFKSNLMLILIIGFVFVFPAWMLEESKNQKNKFILW